MSTNSNVQDGGVIESELPNCNGSYNGGIRKMLDCGPGATGCKESDELYNCSNSCSTSNKRYTYRFATCECVKE